MENKKTKQVLSGVVPVRWGGYMKRVQEGNYVEILCMHVCKWKTKTCWNFQEWGERVKENDGGVEFNYGIL
jgi:hypothetical protein